MRRAWNQVYVHFIWATWDRLPLLTEPLRTRVYQAILAKCEALGSSVEAIGGIDDHVHLLVNLPATLSPATLIKEVKGASSHLATHELQTDAFFKWQGAYGAVTITPSHRFYVVNYIRNQKEHHEKGQTDKSLETITEE